MLEINSLKTSGNVRIQLPALSKSSILRKEILNEMQGLILYL